MSSENTINGITWIDLTNADTKYIKNILNKYEIVLPVEYKLDFGMLPNSNSGSPVYYCSLRFPRLYVDKTNEHRTSFEVVFVIAENLLITLHGIPLFEISNLLKQQQLSPTSMNTPTSSLSLFGIVLTEFYTTIREQLQSISEQLEEIELSLFQKFDKKLIEKISKVSKHLIDIERSIHASNPVLRQIQTLNEQVQSKNITLSTELFYELKSQLDTNRVIMEELRRTHQNMIANHTTTAVRNLSIITFLTLPLGVVVDMLEIRYNPQVAGTSLLILFGIGVMTVLLIVYFRHRRWL